MIPKKIALIGVGLIGGSLGLALKERWSKIKVVGYHSQEHPLTQALQLGVIDEALSDFKELCEDTDFIFIATPISAIIPLIKEIAPFLSKQTIVTDVGSTKGGIVYKAEKVLKGKADFIGGHPLAGSEQKGVSAANAALFKNAVYVLTPTAATPPSAFQKLHWLLTQLGARVLALSPEKHDQVVAAVSHLPHLLAASLVNVAANSAVGAENFLLFAAGGFRDMTRIASGNPNLWVDICLENKEAILQALDNLLKELTALKRVLSAADREVLQKNLDSARELRSTVSRVQLPGAPAVEIDIPVTDRPGTISEITLTFGRLGINIEDIQIIHLSEKSGIIRLLINENPKLEEALLLLKERGFEVIKKEPSL